ncbi:hypothetical protein [Neorhizobium sp. T7_12]|uniref:hypothetical protein n=1 Tax=Neorhizobium sp. T7_12 TaxID=2093832 RepID=UPI000CF9E6DD|nr:hypothetical protein [Neorhizobium sp. T7_12]
MALVDWTRIQLKSMLLVSFLLVRHGVPPTDYQKVWGIEGKEVGDEPETRVTWIVALLAGPIVELISELSSSDDPGDQERVPERSGERRSSPSFHRALGEYREDYSG